MRVGNKDLFPLSRIGDYHGYYMDKDGGVFSTKKGNLTLLQGTVPWRIGSRGGGPRTYTLNSQTVREPFLKSAAFAHADFEKETGVPTSLQSKSARVSVSEEPTPNRAHAKTLEEGLKAKGWLIGTKVDNAISFRSHPAIHLTEESVKDELKRLATTVPGTKFIAVKITHSVISSTLTWE